MVARLPYTPLAMGTGSYTPCRGDGKTVSELERNHDVGPAAGGGGSWQT